MFSREEYISYIEAELPKSGLASDLKLSIHDEFYYDNDADINITVKMLPGQIQCGVTQYPAELLIEIKEKYTKEILDVLTDFSIEHNEVVYSFESGTFKQYYSTPNVVGTFQSSGLMKKTAVSISVSLISFNNVMRLSKFTITSVETKNIVTLEPINFVLSYLVDANASGSISDQFTRSVGETVATSYTITIVPTTDTIFSEVIKIMTVEAKPNARFILSLQFRDENDKLLADTAATTIIQSGSYSQQSNGLPILQLTFIRGEE